MTNKPVDTSKEESQTNIGTRRAKGEFVRGVSGFRGALADTQFPSEPGLWRWLCRVYAIFPMAYPQAYEHPELAR